MKKGRAELKSQSALEYLTTYGWAILIIAIVLAVFLYLGVFNASAYGPTAPPGSCQVSRPYGPGSYTDLKLTGICSLSVPEYIFTSHGLGDYVIINSSSQTSPLNIGNSITITAWVSVSSSPYHDVVDKEGQYGMKLDYENSPHACAPSDYPGWCLEWDTTNDWNGPGFEIPGAAFDKFMFLAVSLDGSTGTKYWYANGAQIGSEPNAGGLGYVPSNVAIGTYSPGCSAQACSSGGYGNSEWFNGAISNVQIYDTALSGNTIQALYNEGINGPPLDLQKLVAWWPLNGNANDYSGNGENADYNSIASNILTVTGGSWWTSYQVG